MDEVVEVDYLLRPSRSNLRRKTWLYAGTPEYPKLLACFIMKLVSDNVSGAGNQQETKLRYGIGGVGSSETIRHAPLLNEEIVAYLNGAAHDATLNKVKRIRFSQKYPEWLEILKGFLLEAREDSQKLLDLTIR